MDKRQHRSIALAFLVLLSLALGLVGSTPQAEAIDKDVAQRILRASVKLMTPFDADENSASICSGSMLDQQGYILTNFHCVGYPTSGPKDEDLESLGLAPGDLFNAKGLSVVAITDDPRRLPRPAYVAQMMSHDPELDIAVLKVIGYYNSKQELTETLPVIAMDVADSEAVQTLDDVIVVGYPGIAGDSVTATEGRIAGFIDEDDDGKFDWFKTDVLVNQGNSGGSALNADGELIGVPTARLQDRSGNVIYLVRPVNRAAPYIEEARRVGASDAQVDTKAPRSPGKPVTTVPASKGTFDELVFGAAFDDNIGITGEATTFSSGIKEVHAGLPYEDMRDGTSWGYMWQYAGQDITGDMDLKWDFGQSGVADLSLSGKKGLTDGEYNLQVYLRGELVQEGGFTVGRKPGNNRPPQKPERQADSGVAITGTVIDYATRRPIQSAIIVFLYPGLTVDDFDADESEEKIDTVFSYGITDKKGMYTLNQPLERSEIYSVIVGAKGYVRIAEDDALEITEDDPDVIELDPLELDKL